MANYTKTTIGKESRIELHDKVVFNWMQKISFKTNYLQEHNVPFVHSHKENEDIYGTSFQVTAKAIIDGEEISLSTGRNWITS